MLYFVSILIILASVILTLIILAQKPKGGGLSASFGGGSSSNLMGVKRTTDFLEKATWGFGIAIVVFVMSSNAFMDGGSGERRGSRMQDQIDNQSVPQPMQQQQQPIQAPQETEEGGSEAIPFGTEDED